MDTYKPILYVFGAVLINLTLGTFYSIGNLIPYIASYMRNTGNPKVTSEFGPWITASFLLGQGCFMILGAYIERKFNNRIACIIGCLIHCSSTLLTSWVIKKNFILVILVYGFGSGLGAGCSYVAAIIAAQKWFPNRKGLLTGIIVAGFGFGGLIFTPLQTLYMNPTNITPDESGYFPSVVYEKVPNLFLYMGLLFALFQTIGCILAFPPVKVNANGENLDSSFRSPAPNSGGLSNTIVQEDSLPEIRGYTDAFKHRIFYIIGLMMMLVAPGVTFVNSMGKIYGQMYIKDDKFLATGVAIAAVANAMGRLFWGFIMDKLPFSTCYTIKVALFSILITLFPFSFVLASKTLYLIWMLGLFFGFSGTFVLFPILIEQVFGVKYHGVIYGILYIALALASILTSYLIQLTVSPALEDSKEPDLTFKIRLAPCLCIAGLYITSYILFLIAIPIRRLENAISRRVETNNMKLKNNLYNRQDLYPLERATLADKMVSTGNSESSKPAAEKENSLGSIVRYREGKDVKKFSPYGK